MSALGRACVKTLLSRQNGRVQSDLERSSLLRSIRTCEISTKIGMVRQSPEFSHRLGLRQANGKSAIMSAVQLRADNFPKIVHIPDLTSVVWLPKMLPLLQR